MKLVLNSLSSNAFMNLFRTVLLCRLDSTRPIAFSVGVGSDVCNISDSVEEDMSEFISNVSSSYFTINSESDLAKLELSVNGTLELSQESSALASCNVQVLNLGVDGVLHSLESVPVVVYFRRAAGHFTADENEEFLQSRGVDTSKLVVVNSRHCPIQKYTFEPVDSDNGKTTYEVSIETDGSITAESAADLALSLIDGDSNSAVLS